MGEQQSAGEKRRASDDDSVSNGDEDEERCHKLSLKYYKSERRQNCTPSRRRGAGRISNAQRESIRTLHAMALRNSDLHPERRELHTINMYCALCIE